MNERGSYENRYKLISEYGLAKFKRVIPLEKIMEAPNHKQWGWWMDALAYFKLSKKYFSLDDVPEKQKVYGNKVDIREPGKLTSYVWYDNRWEFAGSVHDELYKLT